MNINKITARLKSEACRNHIKKQYETDNHIKDAVSSGRLSTAVYAIVYTAILFFAIGFILGRLL